MKLTNYMALLAILSTIFGCANFTYNNKTYSSSDDALIAQGKHLSEIESKITHSAKKFDKTALVVTPSRKTCEALGVTSKGHASSELIGYVADTLTNDYRKFSDYIIKRNMFASVKSVIDDFPKVAAEDAKSQYDVVVYMNIVHLIKLGGLSWSILITILNRSISTQWLNLEHRKSNPGWTILTK